MGGSTPRGKENQDRSKCVYEKVGDGSGLEGLFRARFVVFMIVKAGFAVRMHECVGG